MENFLHKNKEIQFIQQSGEVLSQERSAKTEVSSRGGSRFTNPAITSTTTTTHNFWIKDDEGKEQSISLKDREIHIREGQRVTVIWSQLTKNNRSCQAVLINHTARTYALINDGQEITSLFKLERFTGISILGAILILFGATYAGYSDDIAMPLAWLFIILRIVLKSIKKRATGKRLNEHLHKIARKVLSTDVATNAN